MEDWVVAQYAEIEAVKAEIEGMKAENDQRIHMEQSLAYTEEAFQKKADELLGISNFIMKNR